MKTLDECTRELDRVWAILHDPLQPGCPLMDDCMDLDEHPDMTPIQHAQVRIILSFAHLYTVSDTNERLLGIR